MKICKYCHGNCRDRFSSRSRRVGGQCPCDYTIKGNESYLYYHRSYNHRANYSARFRERGIFYFHRPFGLTWSNIYIYSYEYINGGPTSPYILSTPAYGYMSTYVACLFHQSSCIFAYLIFMIIYLIREYYKRDKLSV